MLAYLGHSTRTVVITDPNDTARRPSRLNQPTIEDACAPVHVYRKLRRCDAVIGKLLLVMTGGAAVGDVFGQASGGVRGAQRGSQGGLAVLVGYPGASDVGHAGG